MGFIFGNLYSPNMLMCFDINLQIEAWVMTTKLDKLIQQQEKLKAAIAKEKKKTLNQKRKEDTRKKILIGAVIVSEMTKDPQLEERVNQLLSDSLVRDDDRRLFDLPILEDSTEQLEN